MSTKISKQQLNELDAKFEQKLESAVLQVSETEFTQEKAKERRKKANASDLDFCTIYFPKIFDAPFNRMHKAVAKWEKGNYTLEASRWFGKSAFVVIGKAVKHIAMGKGGIVNISHETETAGKNRTDMISRVIQKNKLLCYDYGIKVIQDEKGNHIFQSNDGQTHLIATSVRQGLRSLSDDEFNRFRLSIMDDLYNRQNVKSEAHCKSVYNFITSEVWGMMEPDGLSIFLGNSITEEAPICQIRTEFTEKTGNYYSLPATNEAETKSNWPQKYSIQYIRNNWMPPHKPYDVWMGDYKCQPVEVGEILEPDWIRYPISISLINIIASITAIDPAHGESPAACNKGMATLGRDDKGRDHVLDQYLRQEGYPQLFDYIAELVPNMPNHRCILFENDFAQWTFAAKYYEEWREDTKKTLSFVIINSKDSKTELYGSDKESRMMNLVHPHQTGKLTYVKELKDNPDHKKYKNQNYLLFGSHKNKKLDGLDALATAFIHLPSYITTGAFKSLKKKRYDQKKIEGWFR